MNQRLIKLVCVASSLSTQQYRVRDKTGWLGIRIMCLIQGRIQDFKLEGGALKKFLGVFRVKNHDFTPKNLIFSNFRGACARCAAPVIEETCKLLFQWASTIQTLQYMYAIINKSIDLFRISSTLHVNCIVALNMLQCSCKILVD